MRNILCSLLILLLCACTVRRPVVQGTDTHRADSVFVKETLRDTVITVEADSALIRAYLECDSLGRVRVRQLAEFRAGRRLQPPAINIQDNVLTATATTDSLNLYLQLRERYESHHNTRDTAITVVQTVNRLTWWQTLWVWAGRGFAALLGAAIIYKLLKIKHIKL